MTVRPARLDDLDALAAIFLRCWTESYRGILPDELVTSQTPEAARSRWREALSAPESATLVGLVGDEVAGMTRYGRADDGEATLFSLYVSPAVQGSGLGGELLAAAEAGLAGLAERAVLWVFEANEPSRRFYARRGWTPLDGPVPDPEFGEPVLRLERRLGEGSP